MSKLEAQIEEAVWEVEDSRVYDDIDPDWPKDETLRRERKLKELRKQLN